MISKSDIFDYAKTELETEPAYLWVKFPEYAVLRHNSNSKWYAIVMTISKEKLGLPEKDMIDILIVKSEPILIDSLLNTEGYFPAYHMNKKHWIGIALDGSVERKRVFHLLDSSFEMTKPKTRKK